MQQFLQILLQLLLAHDIFTEIASVAFTFSPSFSTSEAIGSGPFLSPFLTIQPWKVGIM